MNSPPQHHSSNPESTFWTSDSKLSKGKELLEIAGEKNNNSSFPELAFTFSSLNGKEMGGGDGEREVGEREADPWPSSCCILR